jgi:hypothetical protein
MSALSINIQVTDKATPILAELHRELTDRTGLHKYIGASAEAGTRLHIRKAAAARHTTAGRLGASPTGYLTKRAELVQGTGNKDAAEITVTGAIFKRVFGPVTVRPRAKKMLAIPMRAEAYGKRPGEFGDLFLFKSKQGRLFLARQAGEGKLHFLFLLKSVVVLPQDRGLLPSDEQFGQLAELAARGYLRKQMRGLGIS